MKLLKDFDVQKLLSIKIRSDLWESVMDCLRGYGLHDADAYYFACQLFNKLPHKCFTNIAQEMLEEWVRDNPELVKDALKQDRPYKSL